MEGKYCPECGQKAGIGRMNMHALIHEFWHGFTHTDKGIIRLWLDLLLRPRTTYENYFSGHRKKYFSPVIFFLVSFGIYIFLDQKVFDYQDHVTLLKNGQAINDEFTRYVQEHIKTAALIMLPIQALLSWGLFFRRRNLAECIVFWLFCTGFVNTVLTLLTPLRLLLIDEKLTVDFILNLLGILIILVHARAVFGNKLLNSLKVVGVVFILSVLQEYIKDYFLYRHEMSTAIVKEMNIQMNPPTVWDAVKEVYANEDYSPFNF